MNIKEVRKLFPIVKNALYFDTASLSPYCTPVIEALQKFAGERRDFASLKYDEWYSDVERCRKLAANMVGASSDEIAFTKNTSEGVNLTAQMVNWEPGDEVVVFDCDFPTNVYPFLNLYDRGVTVKHVKCKQGRVSLEDIERSLTKRTKLLSISHVFYNSGYRVNLEELGRLCKKKNVLLHIDAAQSLGAIEINVRKAQIDFLSAPGYKWLLSPLGTGIFYINKEHIDKTPVIGWLSVEEPKNLDCTHFKLLESSKRFEAGNLDIGGFLAMYRAMQLINSIEIKRIERRVLELSKNLAEELENSGFNVLSEQEKEHRSGIICLENNGLTKELLGKHNIVATIRDNLRLSPHIYNTEEEIVEVVKILTAARS